MDDSDSSDIDVGEDDKFVTAPPEPEKDELADFCSLYVVVEEAKHLVPRDFFGKSDPYCVITLLDATDNVMEQQSTKACKHTLNPFWDGEAFDAWRHARAFQVLRLQIWNQNKLRPDEFLGEARLSRSELEREEIKAWLPLQPRVKGGRRGTVAKESKNKRPHRVTGELRIQVLLRKSREEAPAKPQADVVGPALFVTVVEARNVDPNPRSSGPQPGFNSCNPYYYLKFGNEVVRGPTIKRCYHPTWCAPHVFPLTSPVSNGVDSTGVLSIRVMHWDRLSVRDKHIGTCSLPLSKFQPAVTVDRWEELTGGQGVGASIRVLVKHHDPRKMQQQFTRTIVPVVIMSVLLEALLWTLGLLTIGFPIPVIGALAGAPLGWRGSRYLWDLYSASFYLWPYLNPLFVDTRPPEPRHSLQGSLPPAADLGQAEDSDSDDDGAGVAAGAVVAVGAAAGGAGGAGGARAAPRGRRGRRKGRKEASVSRSGGSHR